MRLFTVLFFSFSLLASPKEVCEAVISGNHRALKALNQNGSSLDIVCNSTFFTHAVPPIHIASYKGDLNMTNTLLEKGADVNFQTSEGNTALHIAAWKGKLKIANVLLEHDADPNLQTSGGNIALYLAAQEGHLEIVNTLLDKGADVNFQDPEGFTPLYIAAQMGHLDIVHTLLKHGADVNIQTTKGFTALYIAAEKGHLDIVHALLKRGAEVNPQSTGHSSPALHVAAQEGHLEIVNTLLDKGADVNFQDPEGFTALHFAAQNGYWDVARALLEHGADCHLTTTQGQSVFGLAREHQGFFSFSFFYTLTICTLNPVVPFGAGTVSWALPFGFKYLMEKAVLSPKVQNEPKLFWGVKAVQLFDLFGSSFPDLTPYTPSYLLAQLLPALIGLDSASLFFQECFRYGYNLAHSVNEWVNSYLVLSNIISFLENTLWSPKKTERAFTTPIGTIPANTVDKAAIHNKNINRQKTRTLMENMLAKLDGDSTPAPVINSGSNSAATATTPSPLAATQSTHGATQRTISESDATETKWDKKYKELTPCEAAQILEPNESELLELLPLPLNIDFKLALSLHGIHGDSKAVFLPEFRLESDWAVLLQPVFENLNCISGNIYIKHNFPIGIYLENENAKPTTVLKATTVRIGDKLIFKELKPVSDSEINIHPIHNPVKKPEGKINYGKDLKDLLRQRSEINSQLSNQDQENSNPIPNNDKALDPEDLKILEALYDGDFDQWLNKQLESLEEEASTQTLAKSEEEHVVQLQNSNSATAAASSGASIELKINMRHIKTRHAYEAILAQENKMPNKDRFDEPSRFLPQFFQTPGLFKELILNSISGGRQDLQQGQRLVFTYNNGIQVGFMNDNSATTWIKVIAVQAEHGYEIITAYPAREPK